MNLQRYSLFQIGCFLLLGISFSGCATPEDQPPFQGLSEDSVKKVPETKEDSPLSPVFLSEQGSPDQTEAMASVPPEAEESIHTDQSHEASARQSKSESPSAPTLSNLDKNSSSDLNTAVYSSAKESIQPPPHLNILLDAGILSHQEESEESLDLGDLFEATSFGQVDDPVVGQSDGSEGGSPKLKSESKKESMHKPRLADKSKSLPAGASKSWKSLNKYKEISTRFESSLREFYDTEKTYSKSVQTLSDFHAYLQKKIEDHSYKSFHGEYLALSEKLVALNLFEFYFYSNGFVLDLERLLNEDEKNRPLHDRAGEFCKVLNNLCAQLGDHYSSYLKGQNQLQEWINHFHTRIDHSQRTQKAFSIKFWTDGKVGGGINELQSLSMAVAQRIPRYKLLIEAALKLGSELETPSELACFGSLSQSFDDLLKQAIQVLPVNTAPK